MEKKKLTALSHLFVTIFIYFFGNMTVLPSITDITMSALCPGQDQCSFAIYLTGIQQAMIGLGMVVMTPLIGNLSDKYGRKSLLTLPLTLNIIPLVILAYSRETNFYYVYYVIRTLTAMVCDGSTNCLALAYVADNISEQGRASAFGVLSGVTSAAYVCGTLAARFLSTGSTFQVAAVASMIAAVYMRIFLKESLPAEEDLMQPILKDQQNIEGNGELPRKTRQSKNLPKVEDLICLLKNSKTFSQAAIVSFFLTLGEGGFQASLLYFLKARFHYNKNQFADIILISGVAGTISQLLFMPLIAPIVEEETLLSIGLFVGCVTTFIYSLSWSAWVPYAIAVFAIFAVFSYPTVRSIASKQVGPGEQGKAQGCISGLSSLASIISPLIFSPLTALFLSERAPFNFPGFSIMCIGLATTIAFIQSTLIKAVPPIPSQISSNNNLSED
ncbi:Tetracycline resistance protein/multidrug resistance protein [Parasponia andersonii]|uniref:Tetracycline resistance protein/multidrug resistance protein n=1 Tax=Parasponia andersonii TaxID=3476 RepID=A0A2P5B8C5_PARAD|nr:Tetracycline resistance protein/multidrug resistance protein [Parasponia andersonii]